MRGDPPIRSRSLCNKGGGVLSYARSSDRPCSIRCAASAPETARSRAIVGRRGAGARIASRFGESRRGAEAIWPFWDPAWEVIRAFTARDAGFVGQHLAHAAICTIAGASAPATRWRQPGQDGQPPACTLRVRAVQSESRSVHSIFQCAFRCWSQSQ